MPKKYPSILDIEKFCNKVLGPDKFYDHTFNGVQIETDESIKKIVSGVTLSMELIKNAVKEKADAILVHHGFQFGEQLFALRSYRYKRARELITKGIGLLAYHLPLDVHLKIGNNAGLAKILKLKKLKEIDAGVVGELSKEMATAEVSKLFEKAGFKGVRFAQHKEQVKKVAIVAGSGNFLLKDGKVAFENPSFDLFVTGDWHEHRANEGREKGYDYMALGHDASEKTGVQELGKMIAKKFKIEHQFVDIKINN